ncbi:hypothetical protein NUW58_g7678 [Xylaria curta]|uniref:Uncharacterized protein n=1 Tax=Xylaria curta TaxID=42375 RepID=A0ACC1NF15_9PEZI|nr:hypothetical protein NUW58_g7678 [Xylaria curta]
MSADLFAAFEDTSQPPSQQTRPIPPFTQPASTPFSFGSPSNLLATNSSQQWGQGSSTSNQFQPSPALATRLASVDAGASGSIQPTKNDDLEDDDGWGDFEVASATGPSPSPSRVAPVTSHSAKNDQTIPAKNPVIQRTRIVRASTLELVSNSLLNFDEPPAGASRPTNQPIPLVEPSAKPAEHKAQARTTNIDPNVLFDADDFDGEQNGEGSDDDFGEFETVPTPAQPSSDMMPSALSTFSPNTLAGKKASELLLDFDLNEPDSRPIQMPQKNLVRAQATTRKQELSKPKPHSETEQPRHILAHMKPQTLEDDWDYFSDLPKQPVKSPTKTAESTWDWDSVEPPKSAKVRTSAEETPKQLSNKDATTHNDDTAWDWDTVDARTEVIAEVDDSTLPPINIPPPSILMSAFPQLFDQASEYLYKPVSGQPQNIKDRVLADTKVYDFLRGYLSLAVVGARIIAGRKLRWHRDKFLSQSMSISAAGSKGMKLAGLDKTQTVREDREAADVVSNWKSQVGRLRTMVASANSTNRSGGKQLRIPEITNTMQVQTARDVPTAPKACVVCGLKRNERLAKVDYEVEDSFGEWWAEHWGHVACKRFWLQHENTLRQR